MELKKRTGKCTEGVFWECVSEIGWSNKNGPDSTYVKRACLKAWTPEFGSSFRDILWEREGEVSRRFSTLERESLSDEERGEYYLGDDGFGDFCSHVVGMGKAVFEDELENPRKLFERARGSDYKEKFSYCIPHEANPQSTWEKWKEMHGQAADTTEEEWKKEWESGRYGYSDDTFEDYLERSRRQHIDHQIGDWSYLDPGHYVPYAKRYHRLSAAFVSELSHAEVLTKDEACALDFATLLMNYFESLVNGDTEVALGISDEATRAWWGLHYIDEDLGALRKSHAALLPMAGSPYGGENTINDHRIYMGGLPGFKCKEHYNFLRENAKS